MSAEQPRRQGLTRRSILVSWPLFRFGKAGEKGRRFPSEKYRYLDPATEFPVYRLTDPAHTSLLPDWYGRAISRKSSFLLFSSDRGSGLQAFRMDVGTGEFRQLTQAESLDGASLRLAPDDRGFYCFDGPSLRYVKLSNLHEKEIYRVPEGWRRGDFSVPDKDSRALLVETQDGRSRLVELRLPSGKASSVLESSSTLREPQIRPQREDILIRQDEDLVVSSGDARQRRTLRTAPGRLGMALWAPGGKTVLYLSFPAESRKPSAIWECDPDANTGALVAETSQYGHFGINGDASVFVGASRSKASPEILLLLRSVRRELTLCEHAASDPDRVKPVFSPQSQHICFQSDRHGKPAIYWIPVDRLVERTPT